MPEKTTKQDQLEALKLKLLDQERAYQDKLHAVRGMHAAEREEHAETLAALRAEIEKLTAEKTDLEKTTTTSKDEKADEAGADWLDEFI